MVGLQANRARLRVNHLLVAYDNLLLTPIEKRVGEKIKDMLSKYEQSSGQTINYKKSLLFFSPNTHLHQRMELQRMFSILEASNLEKYPGLPNITGKGKKKAFQELTNRVHTRTHSWKGRLLSHGGKELFINAVL